MSDDEFSLFHRTEVGIRLGYFQRLIEGVGEFGVPVVDKIVEEIGTRIENGDKEIKDIVAQYADAGVNELIVPDFTLGDASQKRASMDLFIKEVAGR